MNDQNGNDQNGQPTQRIVRIDHTHEDTIMRITAEFSDDYRAGRHPNPADLIRRYPQYTQELVEFVVYFYCIEVDLPDPDPYPTGELPKAAKKAMARIRQMCAAELS